MKCPILGQKVLEALLLAANVIKIYIDIIFLFSIHYFVYNKDKVLYTVLKGWWLNTISIFFRLFECS